jgi:hypothetical protein
MDTESTPQPAKAIRNEQPDFQRNLLENPLHRMPEFITRHEPNVPGLLRRGHPGPDEARPHDDPQSTS